MNLDTTAQDPESLVNIPRGIMPICFLIHVYIFHVLLHGLTE